MYGQIRIAVVLEIKCWVEKRAELQVEGAAHAEYPQDEDEHSLRDVKHHRVALHLIQNEIRR